MNHWQ
jgi:hypothetical protein